MKKFFIALCLFATPLFSNAQSENPDKPSAILEYLENYNYAVLLENDKDFYEELYKHPVDETIYYEEEGTQMDIRKFDGLYITTFYHPASSDIRITHVNRMY